MEYKKDKLYRFAFVLTILSIVDMSIMFLMMAYSYETYPIIWFFIGGFALVIANFIMVGVKRKYERVYEDEPPVGEIVKENAVSFKNFLFKRGTAGFVALLILVSSVVFFAVTGISTLNTSYEKSGAINAGYHFNLREAERYDGLAEEALEKGKEKQAEEFRLNAEKCRTDSEWYYEYHGVLTKKLGQKVKVFIAASVTLAVTVVGDIAFVVIYKKKQRFGE